MAQYGADLIPSNANVIHHCNTGALATVDIGSALGVIYGMILVNYVGLLIDRVSLARKGNSCMGG